MAAKHAHMKWCIEGHKLTDNQEDWSEMSIDSPLFLSAFVLRGNEDGAEL